MSVPQEVRDAAYAAFSARRPGVGLLDLAYDSFVDEPAHGAGANGAHRRLVFGFDSPVVQVDLVYSATSTELTVGVMPAESVEVEVLSVHPQLHLAVRGEPPLSLVTTSTGPSSLAVTNYTREGTPEQWQTSWVTL